MKNETQYNNKAEKPLFKVSAIHTTGIRISSLNKHKSTQISSLFFFFFFCKEERTDKLF